MRIMCAIRYMHCMPGLSKHVSLHVVISMGFRVQAINPQPMAVIALTLLVGRMCHEHVNMDPIHSSLFPIVPVTVMQNAHGVTQQLKSRLKGSWMWLVGHCYRVDPIRFLRAYFLAISSARFLPHVDITTDRSACWVTLVGIWERMK
jgi:hypothetical protein